MVENCVVGYNSTLFTYGQTGSGKTYTMFGADVDSKADVEVSTKWGVIPCVFQLLFSPIGQIHKGPHGVFVQNLSRHPVHCFAQVMELIMRGIEHRKTAGTKLNKESSRSHCVFMCHITVSTADKPRCKTSQKWIAVDSSKRRFSQLNLVDLAGSESAAKSGAEGERLDEACNIKKSLLHLGFVVCRSYSPLLPHSSLALASSLSSPLPAPSCARARAARARVTGLSAEDGCSSVLPCGSGGPRSVLPSPSPARALPRLAMRAPSPSLFPIPHLVYPSFPLSSRPSSLAALIPLPSCCCHCSQQHAPLNCTVCRSSTAASITSCKCSAALARSHAVQFSASSIVWCTFSPAARGSHAPTSLLSRSASSCSWALPLVASSIISSPSSSGLPPRSFLRCWPCSSACVQSFTVTPVFTPAPISPNNSVVLSDGCQPLPPMSVLLSPVFPPFFTAPSFSPFTSASAAAGTHALAPASSSLSSTSAAASTPTPAPTCSSFSSASTAAGTHAQVPSFSSFSSPSATAHALTFVARSLPPSLPPLRSPMASLLHSTAQEYSGSCSPSSSSSSSLTYNLACLSVLPLSARPFLPSLPPLHRPSSSRLRNVRNVYSGSCPSSSSAPSSLAYNPASFLPPRACNCTCNFLIWLLISSGDPFVPPATLSHSLASCPLSLHSLHVVDPYVPRQPTPVTEDRSWYRRTLSSRCGSLRLLVTAHLLSCLACPPHAPFLSLVSATRLFPCNLRALPSLGAPDPVFPFLLPFLPLHLAGIALLCPSSHVSLSRATFLLLRLFPWQPSSLPTGVLLSHDALQHQPLRRWVTNVRYPCLAPSPPAAASLLASAERAFLRNPRPPPLPTTVAISFLPSPNASCPPGFVLARANDTRLLAQHDSSPPPLAPLTRAQLPCSCCASLHLHAVPWASDLPPCSPGVSRHSSASPLAHDLHPRFAPGASHHSRASPLAHDLHPRFAHGAH
ncbi:unnamed protein product [Closterium sp. NIES-54]